MKTRTIKKGLLIFLLFALVSWSYVEIINRHSRSMTMRQKFLRAVYPVLMLFSKKKDKAISAEREQAAESFYKLKTKVNNGGDIDFSELKGKKVLLVNTASDCGYTPQYAELQKLYQQFENKLVIIGFPANDFKEQEKGSDSEIAEFCQVNYGVTFPLAQKSTVVKGKEQNEVFRWLSDKNRNGWNDREPSWNFSKYLVDENGALTNYFDPAVSPLSKEVTDAIAKK